jgi:hypothetical protein
MAKQITAVKALAKLKADPAYVKMRAEQNAELVARAVRLKAEEAPLLKDLKVAGWSVVESVWDLVNTSKPYPTAIPILLSHLKKPYSDRIREGIARALAAPDAAGAWPMLRDEYGCATNTKLRLKAAV